MRNPVNGVSHLEKHFDRHNRVIDALLVNEAARMRAVVDQSRGEIGELLAQAASEGASEKQRRKFFDDAIVSFGERMSAAMLAAVLSENDVAAEAVDARRCIITDEQHGCATPLMAQTFKSTQQQLAGLLRVEPHPRHGWLYWIVGDWSNDDAGSWWFRLHGCDCRRCC